MSQVHSLVRELKSHKLSNLTPPPEKKNYPVTKWASDQNRRYTKEDIQMATKM